MPGRAGVTMEAQMSARFWAAGGVVIAAGLAGLMAGVPPAAGAVPGRPQLLPTPQISRIQDISSVLPKQNAEVE